MMRQGSERRDAEIRVPGRGKDEEEEYSTQEKGVKQGTKTVRMQSHQARIKKRLQERFCLTSESKSGHNRKVNEKREENRKQKNRISSVCDSEKRRGRRRSTG
jgi:hypothetical protein